MLRLLSGALKPESGTVSIDGLEMRWAAPRDLARKIAVVPQHVDPTLSLTVESMVALGRTPYTGLLRPMSAIDRTALSEAMEATDTLALRRQRFNELSGGEQRRVALQSIRSVREIGILAVMHDLNLAALHFSTMIVMESGRVKAQGEPATILTNPDVMSAFRAPLQNVSHPQTGVPQVLLQRGRSER
jgi:iron complex transport system ATP-binding protein